jgi:hypothetical protein
VPIVAFLVAWPALSLILWHVAQPALRRRRRLHFGTLDLLLAMLVAGLALAIFRAGYSGFEACACIALAGMLSPLLWIPKLVLEEYHHAQHARSQRDERSFSGQIAPAGHTEFHVGVRKRLRLRILPPPTHGAHLSPYSLIERPLRLND